MSCCGKARTQQGTISHQRANVARAEAHPASVAAGKMVYFQYFGKTGMTVTGPASSQVYRFLANGAPVAVDARDAASLARVPNLRAMRQA